MLKYVLTLMIIAIASLLVYRDLKRKKLECKQKITSINGIQVTEKTNIGGIPQWIQIRGQDKENPVILVLHGGPGSTLMGNSHTYQLQWEKHYTVVNWDQRGAGKTFNETRLKDVKPTITMNRMIEDVVEVTKYIRKRLNKDKIIILGQSWGTVLAAQAVYKYPEYYLAYVGTGQFVNAVEGEKVCYNNAYNLAKEKGDKKTIKILDKLYPYLNSDGSINYNKWGSFFKIKVKCGYASIKFPSMFAFMSIIIRQLLVSPDYRLKDITSLFRNKVYETLVKEELFSLNLSNIIHNYSIPFYIIHGEKDLQTPYCLAKEYYECVSAPRKKFYTLSNCAHVFQLDNPGEFTRILIEDIKKDMIH